MHAGMHKYVHACIHTYIHTYIHTMSYMHAYIHTGRLMSSRIHVYTRLILDHYIASQVLFQVVFLSRYLDIFTPVASEFIM